jgi:hypothetical protein
MRYTPRVHDVSMYHGKYYLYFGAVPAAVVLFLPWRLLTGSDLPQYWAGALFAGMGYLFTVALLGRVKRDCLPWLPPGLLFVSALILGLVNWWPLLLSRVGVWETCISCAYCFSCLALLCLYNGMRDGPRCGWLAASSLCMGLAIASRPNYFFGAAVLLVPLVRAWREERPRPARVGAWVGRICAVLVPIACVGALVALYDYQRFGDPLELGTGHMILYRPNPTHPFSLGYAWFNILTYYPGPRPPFAVVSILQASRALPPIPRYYVWSRTTCTGSSPTCRSSSPRPSAPSSPGRAGVQAWRRGSSAALLASSRSADRSSSTPGPTTVTSPMPTAGCRSWRSWGSGRSSRRIAAGGAPARPARAAWGLLAAYSAVFAFCAGVQRDEIFRQVHPGAYRRVAHALDYPPSGMTGSAA